MLGTVDSLARIGGPKCNRKLRRRRIHLDRNPSPAAPSNSKRPSYIPDESEILNDIPSLRADPGTLIFNMSRLLLTYRLHSIERESAQQFHEFYRQLIIEVSPQKVSLKKHLKMNLALKSKSLKY